MKNDGWIMTPSTPRDFWPRDAKMDIPKMVEEVTFLEARKPNDSTESVTNSN